jgi:two-component system, sensor histidine kinase and response regulator
MTTINRPPLGTVLVADDQEIARVMLSETLRSFGYNVLAASSGQMALDRTIQSQPHAVLLDVMMPDLDGFEVCRRLKQHPETGSVPVLMVTALTDNESRMRGIEAGADDFLSKPIRPDELRLRVRNACRMKQLYDETRNALVDLRVLEEQRDGLVHMIAHDMRSPATTIMGYLELLETKLKTHLGPDHKRMFDTCHSQCQRLNGMIGDMLDLSRMERVGLPLKRQNVAVQDLVTAAVHQLGPRAERVRLDPTVNGQVHVDTTTIQRVLINLLDNALAYSPKSEPVRVGVVESGDRWRFEVTDAGAGIPPDQREHLFDKFVRGTTGENTRRSVGLGLAFCKLAVQAHDGAIGIGDAVPKGSVFWFILPKA